MTPAEHYAEAMRLRALAVEHWMNPEGGYDDEPATASERAIRSAVLDDARADAALWLAEAQLHATLALYREDDPTGCLWERPADDTPAPVPDGREYYALSGRKVWPQDHAQDVAVIVGVPLTGEPGPEVIQVIDHIGRPWTRDGAVWNRWDATDGYLAEAAGWSALADAHGPLRIGAVR